MGPPENNVSIGGCDHAICGRTGNPAYSIPSYSSLALRRGQESLVPPRWHRIAHPASSEIRRGGSRSDDRRQQAAAVMGGLAQDVLVASLHTDNRWNRHMPNLARPRHSPMSSAVAAPPLIRAGRIRKLHNCIAATTTPKATRLVVERPWAATTFGAARCAWPPDERYRRGVAPDGPPRL